MTFYDELGRAVLARAIGSSFIFALLVLIIVSYLYLRSLRARSAEPRYLPTKYLKQKWQHWTPFPAYDRASGGEPDGPSSVSLSNRGSTVVDASDEAGVDRNTSVRSVITLPAYMSEPGVTEKVLGRAGERDGVDVIVDHPETIEEEEARREDEMERLYQLRLARREEHRFREENRRLRDEARARGDWNAVRELRAARRNRGSSTGSGNNAPSTTAGPATSTGSLPASRIHADDVSHSEHERRISSISYADVGLARLDGSRLRASSESEHPLMDNRASLGERNSRSPSRRRPSYTRHYSASSVVSVSTDASETQSSDHRRHSNSVHGAPTTIRLGHSRNSSRSQLESIEDPTRVTEQTNQLPDPPDYENLPLEEAPPYESPVRSTVPQLPQLSALPAIEVTVSSPANSAPTTPASPVRRDSRRQQEDEERGRVV
ncbi:MAG: hypothetical protein M1837_006016 [Sclerophora amabilis]|nr:MAG: hypothetical protein M1837_006016 [Sclerophora amabilis]